MSANPIRDKWIEAAKIFSENLNAEFPCPECEHGFLRAIRDEELWDNKIDRWIACDKCGRYNTMLMEKPNKR